MAALQKGERKNLTSIYHFPVCDVQEYNLLNDDKNKLKGGMKKRPVFTYKFVLLASLFQAMSK